PVGWIVWRMSRFENFAGAMLFDVAGYRQNPALPRFRALVETSSRLDALVDGLAGVAAAANPFGEHSYASSLGAAAYAPLLAVAVLVARREVGQACEFLRLPSAT